MWGGLVPPNDHSLLARVLRAVETQAHRRALYDVATAVTNAVRCAVDLVPSADAGAVSVSSPSTDEAPGATSASAADLDAIQHRLDEGPCLSALHGPRPGRTVVVAEDLAGSDATRWPRFAPSAVELGFPAVLSLQLPGEGRVGAALNLYGREAGSFGPGDLVLADMFLEHLAHLLLGKAAPGASPGGHGEALSPEVEHQLRRQLDRPAGR